MHRQECSQTKVLPFGKFPSKFCLKLGQIVKHIGILQHEKTQTKPFNKTVQINIFCELLLVFHILLLCYFYDPYSQIAVCCWIGPALCIL